MAVKESLKSAMTERVLVLDGAMGTMIQRAGLTRGHFHRGEFAEWPCELQGNNDLLSLTAPDEIRRIHEAYIAAGADIISTNSFNANAISQADYQLADRVRDINLAAARLAREAADKALRDSGRIVWVAGSVGPTNRSASMSPDVEDPAARNVTFADLKSAYSEQIAALIEGGADVILAETVFDTLNLKAALAAADEVSHKLGREIPVMVSATISDRSGRILSGQSLDALIVTLGGYTNIISLGLNCSMGPRDMGPHIRTLAESAPVAVTCHPNAGLPDALGQYRETPDEFAAAIEPYLREGLLNIIGGCCGTTPDHIARLAEIAARSTARSIPAAKAEGLRLAGLDALTCSPLSNFTNVGERCNVAGSRKFLRLIKEKSYEEAARIAARQVESGALMIDINMDDALLDAPAEMEHFLRLIGSDPDIARVPVMIDSSDWRVIERGLQSVQGKCVVNSISLKEGEEEFLRRATVIRSFGAAVVVMAFDEEGQADTLERRIDICRRAYNLLTLRAGFDPEDIIFDPNVMAVATGIADHDLYGRHFLDAIEWIKSNLPGAKVSGGVSNLSFAFRGHNMLRESMHAVFLYHARLRGMDMGIVNPEAKVTYDDIDPTLRDLIERLLLTGDHDAAAALGDYALSGKAATSTQEAATDTAYTERPVSERLKEAIVRGRADRLDADLAEALESYPSAVSIIEGPLMEGISEVGRLFGEGKMFLPQVVKASRVMKQAVTILRPVIEAAAADRGAAKAGRILFATVKGDVHDIGKNIVSIVLECNNYEVIDMGVMVPAEDIVEAAISQRPDMICLSGLITPSLGEMVRVAEALRRAGVTVPLVVGGATTSPLHTALKIAPAYGAGVVVHASDAANNPVIASRLFNPDTAPAYIREISEAQEALRADFAAPSLLSLDEARSRALSRPDGPVAIPASTGLSLYESIPLDALVPLINWRPFFHAWKLTGADSDPEAKSAEAKRLKADAIAILDQLQSSSEAVMCGAAGVFPAYSEGDDIITEGITLPTLRRQTPDDTGRCPALADYIAPEGCGDYTGIFVATTGPAMRQLINKAAEARDDYRLLLTRTLADRLAEASAEYLHREIRTRLWGYAPDESLTPQQLHRGEYQGIRPAVGYPMLPDQTLLHSLANILPFGDLGITLTDNGAMSPAATVCAIAIASPEARYFLTGPIGEDQLRDYARRRNLPLSTLRTLLARLTP